LDDYVAAYEAALPVSGMSSALSTREGNRLGTPGVPSPSVNPYGYGYSLTNRDSVGGRAMLEIEDRAASPAYSAARGVFEGLAPGDKILIHPSIPRPVEHREYRVQHVEAGAVVLRERPSTSPVSIAASSVAQLHSRCEQQPARLVLKGRLQWITARRQWTVMPEEPPTDSEHGLCRQTSADDAGVVELIEHLRQRGYSPWWVPVSGVREFLAQGGEIIYDLDGRYLRTRDQKSEWILLGKDPEVTVLP
jgi:hypothetical protein